MFDSPSPRYVTRVSGTRKDHRLEKYKSNLDISEVPTLKHSRIGPTKRLKDKSDVRKARLEIYTSTKRTTRLHSSRPRKNGYSRLRQQQEPGEREFVVDSGDSMHMISEKDLNSAELETMTTPRSPTTVMTANDEVRTNKEATENIKQLDLLVTVKLLQETPAVLSLGKLCEEHGYTYPLRVLATLVVVGEGLVPVRIRTWQGSEEPARGHRCGWPQGGSHWVWEGTRALYSAIFGQHTSV